MKPGMLKTKELEEYRLCPLDNVLERRVFLADARYWVPVMPDDSVPCLVPSTSWRRWAFELSHLTFINPQRTGGETFQIMRRLGYWKNMSADMDRWLYACQPCQKVRSKPVQGPMRSITGDDAMRTKVPGATL